MIRSIAASLAIEILKTRRAMIFRVTLAVACFMSCVLALMIVLVKNPEVLPPGLLKTKVNLAAITADWPSYFGFTQMATGAIGILLFGFIAIWIFARENGDRTLKDILALPVSRTAIVVSKLVAAFLWSTLLVVIMYGLGLVFGWMIGLPHWSAQGLCDFTHIFFICSLLSLCLQPIAAFVASAGRGYLPAIGFLLLCMGLANLFANIGLGAYFPWAIPMIFAGASGPVAGSLPAVSYIIIAGTSVTGTVATVLFWKYADHCR